MPATLAIARPIRVEGRLQRILLPAAIFGGALAFLGDILMERWPRGRVLEPAAFAIEPGDRGQLIILPELGAIDAELRVTDHQTCLIVVS